MAGEVLARSAAVVQSPFIRTTTWLRMPGDVVFGLGALCVVVFTVKAVVAACRWRQA